MQSIARFATGDKVVMLDGNVAKSTQLFWALCLFLLRPLSTIAP